MNRAPRREEQHWSAAIIAADPQGAFLAIRELMQNRVAWHRKFDKAEQREKIERRRAEVAEAAIVSLQAERDFDRTDFARIKDELLRICDEETNKFTTLQAQLLAITQEMRKDPSDAADWAEQLEALLK